MFIEIIIILTKLEVDVELVLKMAATFSHLRDITSKHTCQI